MLLLVLMKRRSVEVLDFRSIVDFGALFGGLADGSIVSLDRAQTNTKHKHRRISTRNCDMGFRMFDNKMMVRSNPGFSLAILEFKPHQVGGALINPAAELIFIETLFVERRSYAPHSYHFASSKEGALAVSDL